MINPETQQLTEKALKVNFNEVQQARFDRLMSELEEISGGLGFSELKKKAEAGNKKALQVMHEYVAKKEQIVALIEIYPKNKKPEVGQKYLRLTSKKDQVMNPAPLTVKSLGAKDTVVLYDKSNQQEVEYNWEAVGDDFGLVDSSRTYTLPNGDIRYALQTRVLAGLQRGTIYKLKSSADETSFLTMKVRINDFFYEEKKRLFGEPESSEDVAILVDSLSLGSDPKIVCLSVKEFKEKYEKSLKTISLNFI